MTYSKLLSLGSQIESLEEEKRKFNTEIDKKIKALKDESCSIRYDVKIGDDVVLADGRRAQISGFDYWPKVRLYKKDGTLSKSEQGSFNRFQKVK